MNAPLLQLSAYSIVLLTLVAGMPRLAIASSQNVTLDSTAIVLSTPMASADDYLPDNTGLPERRSGGGTR